MTYKAKVFSVGNNKKLAREVGVLNLPAGKTCPGRTAICTGLKYKDGNKMKTCKCYAVKAERMYPSVLPFREKILQITKSENFVKDACEDILRLGLKLVRFHESGDVYSQEYLGKLFQIADLNPNVKFWMYTKTFDIHDWTGIPNNLVVYRSVDRTTVDRLDNTHTAIAHAPVAFLRLPGDSLEYCKLERNITDTCDHKSDKHYCGTECTKCVDGQVSVYFDVH